jgi:hypothetical protein
VVGFAADYIQGFYKLYVLARDKTQDGKKFSSKNSAFQLGKETINFTSLLRDERK